MARPWTDVSRSRICKIARDDANLSKGYGFVSFSNFEAADEAIANFNGQYLMNKEVAVQYAYKKDGKGERHGDEAERLLATQARKHNIQPTGQPLPSQLFNAPPAAAPPVANGMTGMNGMPGPPTGAPVPAQYNAAPLQAPPRYPNQAPLPPPPLSGLPARPPPSQAGYGGPTAMLPPGFVPPMGAYPQGAPMAPPPGFPMGPPMGMPPVPGMPPGFQQHNYQQQGYGHR